ncbi:ketopantoate hydroxymethyltransferase-domain-containing protein [Cristinia sonorae]|uniref:3-methyl-2-oxobutanoate hydroxymethyltransferase n=1 Tax=Cristinia sonorae TaxID=1940300 RepID=A0A8K0UUU2_9AGAR|nr:ketopantoate hydroxymethyltransferase-domain-containing protein [Cristinia sonorae]
MSSFLAAFRGRVLLSRAYGVEARRWMSVRPEEVASTSTARRRKVTIQYLNQLRKAGTPITMVTAYDYPTGRACETHGVDITLVGDSLAQVCLGYDSTTRLTLDEMIHHCRAVARGSKSPFLVADMPFGSYHVNTDEAVRNAIRMVREGGVEGVKIEASFEGVEIIRKLTSIGIPVMAHVGLMPQRHTFFSGYRVQGRTAACALEIAQGARALQEAGAFAIVLEAIPRLLGMYITKQLDIPTIGIGAGVHTDGQVLVWDDLMSVWGGHKAKFVRQFGDVKSAVESGLKGYTKAVRERSFPDDAESYSMPDEEWEKFLKLAQQEGLRGAGDHS